MTKEQLKEAIKLFEKAEKEHPHANFIEWTGSSVQVLYTYHSEISEMEPF